MKMSTLAVLTALTALTGAPALAQAPAAPAAPAAAVAAAKFSVETTPIEVLAANPAAKAVLDKNLPGMTTHEAYDQFKSMTLTQVAPMSEGAITDAALKTVQADLDLIK